MTSKKILPDFLISLALIAFTLYYAAHFVDFSIPPFEDAAMLMRYAQNFAGGHGIVWNIGEPPVDGATDFLFMVASAALIKLGLTVGQAVRGIGFVSHLLTILIIYWANRRVHHANLPLALFSALYLAVGTGLSYVSAYFGTPFFALAAVLTWTLGLILTRREKPRFWLILAFALSGLVAGLIRPEGVILASLILLAVLVMRGLKNSTPILLTFGAVFLVLGGMYFLWRWDYFGYPLPNPFYKKSGSALHWDSYSNSLLNLLRLCLPFAAAFILGLRSRQTAKQAFASLIPILGFAMAFILISDEMNYGARFQYALLPIVLLSWIPLVSGLSFPKMEISSVWERVVYAAALVFVFCGLVYYSWAQNCFLVSQQPACDTPYERDGRYDMGKLLAEYRGKGYVIAATEAGLLPYYSGWTAVDTWGLNDQFIAHHGGLTTEYLDRYKPHIIMFHDYYSPLVPPKLTEANLAQPWFRMTITMKEYAEANRYVLAAVFGDSPYDTHYYYVRTDFEDSERLIKQISEMKKYYYPTTGKKSINYAGYAEQ
ncbi:MAG: CPP1-like family protein [Chloroflexi bacterium]|nr:CPP1-like family protein [Chloroflexota bacterium]